VGPGGGGPGRPAVRVTDIDAATLARWQGEAAARTTYLFDVRTEEEYKAGHLPGAVHARAGSWCRPPTSNAAVGNARIVLADDDGVRATMTASWLRQLGWTEAVVLTGGVAAAAEALGVTLVNGGPPPPRPGPGPHPHRPAPRAGGLAGRPGSGPTS